MCTEAAFCLMMQMPNEKAAPKSGLLVRKMAGVLGFEPR